MNYVAPTGISYAAGAIIIVVGIILPLTVMVRDRELGDRALCMFAMHRDPHSVNAQDSNSYLTYQLPFLASHAAIQSIACPRPADTEEQEDIQPARVRSNRSSSC
jgi:hypothetical protein